MKVDAFFEGGGILGISFIGACKALMDSGIYIDNAIGISSGSMVASLIMSGFSANDLINILNVYRNFNFFKQKTTTARKKYIGNPLSILLNKGIYDSEVIETFMEEILLQKGVSIFSDLMVSDESKLKIIAADFTNKRMLLLPDDLPLYGINPKTFKVSKAIRMSCAIPFFYTPYELKTNKTNYIIDGGVIRKIPTSIVNKNKELNKLTLRFRIKDKGNKWVNLFDDIKNTTYIKKDVTSFERMITIHHDGLIKMTDFDINKEQLIYLYKQGYKAAHQFIKEEFYE